MFNYSDLNPAEELSYYNCIFKYFPLNNGSFLDIFESLFSIAI
jgi:hypothetical protein